MTQRDLVLVAASLLLGSGFALAQTPPEAAPPPNMLSPYARARGRRLMMLTVITVSATCQAEDYTYTTDGGAITITGYTGSGGAVTIPSTINGLPAHESSSSTSAIRQPCNAPNFALGRGDHSASG